MSDNDAIRMSGVCKTFRTYVRPHHRLLPRRVRPPCVEFHALRGIDLTIARGEAVGIVGRNGAVERDRAHILASASWRVTRPLRAARRWLRRCRPSSPLGTAR